MDEGRKDVVIELFVDDQLFAVAAIVAWLALIGLGVAAAGGAQSSAAVALFMGLAAVLATAIIRTPRRQGVRQRRAT